MDITMNPPNKLAPEMPTEPTKEALAMNFNLDDNIFNEDSGATTITSKGNEIKEIKETPAPQEKEIVQPSSKEAPKQQEKVKEFSTEEKKEEPKIEEKPKSVLKPPTKPKEEQKKEEEVVVAPKEEQSAQSKTNDGPIVPPTKKEDAFDYSKFSPQEVINLKNMSRQSREFTAKLIEENKKLATQKDGLYLQHEQGYLLSPEYRDMAARRDMLVVEGNAWKQALLNIRNAKPYKEPIGYDNGKLVLSEEKQPSDEAELRISQIFNNTSNQYSNTQAQINNYPKQFGDRVNADLIIIKDLQKQLFGWHSDPELMNHSVEVNGKGDQTLNQIKQEFISQWPPYMSSHPAVQVAADLVISLRIRDAELREARAAATVANIKQKEVARGEPSSSEAPAKQTQNQNKSIPSVFSLDGMPS